MIFVAGSKLFHMLIRYFFPFLSNGLQTSPCSRRGEVGQQIADKHDNALHCARPYILIYIGTAVVLLGGEWQPWVHTHTEQRSISTRDNLTIINLSYRLNSLFWLGSSDWINDTYRILSADTDHPSTSEGSKCIRDVPHSVRTVSYHSNNWNFNNDFSVTSAKCVHIERGDSLKQH
jgi:hypothetical protein